MDLPRPGSEGIGPGGGGPARPGRDQRKRPTKYVLDDRATGGLSEIREIWHGCAAFAGRDRDQAAVEGKRPTKSVLDDRATGGVAEIREVWRGGAAFAGREGDQAAVGAKAAAQPVGVSSSIREAGCVATRSRTSLKYRKGSTPASLQPCARV